MHWRDRMDGYRYDGNHYDCPCGPQPASEYIPQRIAEYEAEAGKCHALIDRFNALFTMHGCRQGAVCEALIQASDMFPGIVISQAKKDRLTMLVAAHMLDEAVISATSMQAKGAKVARGEDSPVTQMTVAEGSPEWFGLTVWGLEALGIVKANARLGVLVV